MPAVSFDELRRNQWRRRTCRPAAANIDGRQELAQAVHLSKVAMAAVCQTKHSLVLMHILSYTQAFVESWIDFSTNEIDGPLLSWILPHFGMLPYDKKVRSCSELACKRQQHWPHRQPAGR